MTTNRTKRQVAFPNRGNLGSAGETVYELKAVARPSATKRRPSFTKVLSVMALMAATIVFAPSCAVSGSESDMQKETYASGVKRLSVPTVEGLMKDTGVEPIYVLVITPDNSLVIGVPPNVKPTVFDDDKEYWKGQGKVEIESISPATFLQYLRNPKVHCVYYYSQGSMKKKCFEK